MLKRMIKAIVVASITLVSLPSHALDANGVIHIATGGEGGSYDANAKTMKSGLKHRLNLDSIIHNFNGSEDIVNAFNDDTKFDIAIIQNDTERLIPITRAHTKNVGSLEYVWFWHNPKNTDGTYDVDYIDHTKHGKLIDYLGSGGSTTLAAMAVIEDNFKVLREKRLELDDIDDIADALTQGHLDGEKVSGVILVGSMLDRSLMETYPELRVGVAQDNSFDNNGHYNHCTVKQEHFPFMVFAKSKMETTCLNRVVLISKDFMTKMKSQLNRRDMRSIKTIIKNAVK